MWVGSAMHKNKVAGCEWEYTLFKEIICDPNQLPNTDPDCYSDSMPIEEPDGSYAQLGVVNSRCTFNGNSEQCQGSLCDSMTITMQGGTCVYYRGKTPGSTESDCNLASALVYVHACAAHRGPAPGTRCTYMIT